MGARWIGPGPRELKHARWRRLIQRELGSPATIAVFSPLGGVGKTTTTIHLGHVLAMVRADLVLALDANPDCGNLVQHLDEPPSGQGAAGLHRGAHRVARCTDLLPYVTEAGSGLWVVRSDRNPAARLGATEYRRILEVATTYASLVVADLGTGLREPGFLAIAESADALIGIAPPEDEGMDAVIDAIDSVNQRFPGKNRVCAVVANAARARSRPVPLGELAGGSDLYVDQVLQVPHDPHLAAGGTYRWNLLSRPTQEAYLQLTATVVTLLAEQERQSP